MGVFRTQNPADETFIQEYPYTSDQELESILEAAERFYQERHRRSIKQRQQWLLQLADTIEESIEGAAQIATAEMGKPIREARAELAKSALTCRYYAAHAPEMLAPQNVDDFAKVEIDALGPLLAIMPWNFPFFQLFRVLAPAIALGNPVILKHAENVCGTALACQDMVRRAQLPDAVLQTIFLPVSRVQDIIRDPRVRGVTLTGSERAGRAVAAQAGEALKPVVLELGGSDPFIVLSD